MRQCASVLVAAGVMAFGTASLQADVINEDAKLRSSDGESYDHFGISVSVSGDTLVAGAVWEDAGGDDAGAAYVFRKSGSQWTQVAKLMASDVGDYGQFGGSVSISGDTIVVGAVGANVYGDFSGATYLYVEPGGGWAGTLTETAKLVPSDGVAGDAFGCAVSISGDGVVAGTYYHGGTGAAYVFQKPGGGWSGTLYQQAKLLSSDGTSGGSFGLSASISGDTVVVGAPYGGGYAGAAYVFQRPGGGWAGTLNENAKLVASDAAQGEYLGSSVAISGDTLVAGAPDAASPGAAYVFVKPDGGWSGVLIEEARLLASDGETEDEFGCSVHIEDDTVVVGAQFDGDVSWTTGAAYLFHMPFGAWAGTLNEDVKLLASDGDHGDFFGSAVTVSGDRFVIGAGSDDDIGSAYVFEVPYVNGACCIGSECFTGTEADCLAAFGAYMGDDTDCEYYSCFVGCAEDLADPEGVEQQDLNAVLNRWGDATCLPGGVNYPCPEDLAAPDGVEQQDLNAVLNRWGDPDCA